MFEGTRKPLRLWFLAKWFVTSQKHGASALGLQRVLGLGSYQTAWVWLHELRRAMVSPGRELLIGPVEVDETYVGAPEQDVHGREAPDKSIVAIAAEDRGARIGRIRIHEVITVRNPSRPAHELLPHVHRVASLLKRWLMGTHHGGVHRHRLAYYLDEFTFRFNRRSSGSRGLLFYRLMEQAIATPPTPLGAVVGGRATPTHSL